LLLIIHAATKGPLANGKLQVYEVECPWHQSKFDMRTGEVKIPPAVEPQTVYQVKVQADDDTIYRRDHEKRIELINWVLQNMKIPVFLFVKL
jgi:hypothetical protein